MTERERKLFWPMLIPLVAEAQQVKNKVAAKEANIFIVYLLFKKREEEKGRGCLFEEGNLI